MMEQSIGVKQSNFLDSVKRASHLQFEYKRNIKTEDRLVHPLWMSNSAKEIQSSET